MQNRFLFVIAAVVGFLPNVLLPNLAGAAVFFSEDFENLGATPLTPTTPDLTAAGWVISNTAATVELEAEWILLDTTFAAGAAGLPTGSQFGPATANGGTTPGYEFVGPGGTPTVPGGFFISSLSDGTDPFDPPTHPGGPIVESPIGNATYSGASNDIWTPSFSTAGAAGDVWLHASVSANLNDNGQAIFDIDVSTDGGINWVNRFRRIAPGSGRNFANGDFDSDLSVDGSDFLAQQRLADFSDCTDCGSNGSPSVTMEDFDENRTDTAQRFSDWEKSYQGAYTPVVATAAAGNAGGVHGPLSVNLGAIGGEADVKVRFRQFESRDDKGISIDNIVIDELSPAGSASQPIFFEDFNSLSLGTMGVYTYSGQVAGALFLTDTGGGSSTISGFSWGAEDRASPDNPSGRYTSGSVGRQGVNNLGHPTPKGASGEVPFAIIDSASEEDGMTPDNDNIQSERLHTTVLDFSLYSTVILEWDDETIYVGDPSQGSEASVVLMIDDDGTSGPSPGDSMINFPSKAGGGNGIFNPYTPYDQFAGGSFSGSDDPIFARHRLDISADVAGLSNIYIAFQYVSSDTEYWAIDNVRITGELASLSAGAVPEPSSLLLALVGLPVFGAFRRRRPIG